MQIESTRQAYQRAILTPLSICLALLLAAFLLHIWSTGQRDAEKMHRALRESTQKSIEVAVKRDTEKLSALLTLVVRDQALQRAFVQRDRSRLFSEVGPLFQQLRGAHGVTHFYFMTPEREMFLRVHQPHLFGDTIKRRSALEAERQGRIASGLEMGPLGLFTLRVVSPWRDSANQLVGYIELGMEIDQTLVELQQIGGYDFLMLIDKKNLDKEKWLSGMRAIGRAVDWDRFESHVIIGKTAAATDEVLDLFRREVLTKPQVDGTIKVAEGNRTFAFDESPLRDLSGLTLGKIIIIRDVSTAELTQRYLILRVVMMLLIVWVVLILLARRVVNQVYDRLHATERQREEFKRRARRDPLTGLFNHVSIYHRLSTAMTRSKMEDLPLAVLMFDIDHFKQINDTHGHPAGDEVLRRVARVLQHAVRPEDSVGRYGGEEFAIVLPGMEGAAALNVAERIRREVEQLAIEFDGAVVPITISGGLALASEEDDTPESLVARADRAMYAAKNTGRNKICQ